MIDIAVLGDRNLEYVTHRELDAALGLFPDWARGEWVSTDSDVPAALDRADGVWIVSGGPYRDDDAVYAAIRHVRERGTPLLATCSGFQYVVIELARSLAGIDAHHAETDPDAEALVAAPLACSLVGEERMVTCVPGTRLAELCGTEPFPGFHWCNYGLADEFVDTLTAAGVVVGAHAPDAGVEGIELSDHPFFVATLFQPQVGALAGRPLHPLIAAFLETARAAQPSTTPSI
ncbi:MAG TPA: gamma-glutamyl-gamma-aminobutyrate hydrolase family protein [Solirubrobacteraceae bacterium]|nr:gamma-glutamyl-gamma-aminobutyrate hydrolase family protein [Solirubrobacteraceae bacterium]